VEDQKRKKNDGDPLGLALYVAIVTRLGYGFFIGLALTGVVLGKTDQAIVVMIVTVLLWTTSKIMSEAIEGYQLARMAYDVYRLRKGPRSNKDR